MAQPQRRPERPQERPLGRPEGTRGAERSEHRSALDGRSAGRSYLRAPEDGLQRLGVSRSPTSTGSLTLSASGTQGKARQPEGSPSGGGGEPPERTARGGRLGRPVRLCGPSREGRYCMEDVQRGRRGGRGPMGRSRTALPGELSEPEREYAQALRDI